MSKVIVAYDDNWADEISFVGISLFDKDEWGKISAALTELKEPVSFSIGSNEDCECANGAEFLRNCKVHEIPEEELEAFERNLKAVLPYGYTKPFPHSVIENIGVDWE